MKIKIIFFLLKILNSGQCPENDQMCLSCAGTQCTACIGSFINSDG